MAPVYYLYGQETVFGTNKVIEFNRGVTANNIILYTFVPVSIIPVDLIWCIRCYIPIE